MYFNKKTIHDLPSFERPREKLVHYGPEKLTNAELLAILLRSGKRGENVLIMAEKIIKKFSEKGLQNTNFEELNYYSGLGPAKACEVVACFELGRRFLQNKKAVLIMSPEDVWREMADLRDNKKEHFVVFFLDIRNQKIKRQVVSIGTLNANLVHPREVFEDAIRHNSAQIIVAHNHPSGDTEPSDEDLQITHRLKKAGEILGIELLDHVIVAGEGWLSLKESNNLL